MKKAIIEKGTGEKYASKSAMVKKESKSTKKKESGKGKSAVSMMMKYT